MMKKLLVRLNQESFIVDPGLEVQHIISASDLEACRTGTAIIIDQWGNEVGLEGALFTGEELTVKYIPKPK
jgi:hypothetical protein